MVCPLAIANQVVVGVVLERFRRSTCSCVVTLGVLVQYVRGESGTCGLASASLLSVSNVVVLVFKCLVGFRHAVCLEFLAGSHLPQ